MKWFSKFISQLRGSFLLSLTMHASIILLLSATEAKATEAAVPGQFIVKFSSDTASSFKTSVRSALGVRSVKKSSLTKTELVELAGSKPLNDKLAKDLLAAGIIEYIEPNYIYTTSKVSNDVSFPQLWGLHNNGSEGGTTDIDIDAPEAWDVTTGGNEIVIGVVDTGIDYTHPDLAGNIWVNPFEQANSRDDDGNGVVDDRFGFNAISRNGNPMDDNGHGTHVAGIIGALGNNQIGISGVAWKVKLMGLKFLNSSGSGTTQAAIDAINYAVTMKNRGINIRALNNSWGGAGSSQALRDAIVAANNAGILFIAAAGNNANDNDTSATYPANYNIANVISVAALDRNGNLATFSNYGRATVHVAAPGVGILSTYPGNNYARLDGTSMATPYVSGIAALLAAKHSSLSTPEIRQRILETVKPLDQLNGMVAFPGIVSAKRALDNSKSRLPDPALLAKYVKSTGSYQFDESLGEKVLSKDDGYHVVSLGFSFPFYGENFTRLALSANGRIIPLATGATAPTGTDFSNKVANGIIPFNDDLFPSPFNSGGIYFKQDTTGATITWVVVNYAHRNSTNSRSEITFQVKLFKSGEIEYRYKDTFTNDSLFDYGASASIGIAPITGIAGDSLTISHNTNNKSEIGNLKSLRLSPTKPAAKNGKAVHADFDGDGKSDLVVYRPHSGMWYLLPSSSGFSFAAHQMHQLGLPGDIPLVGDFDGDSKSEMVVWRPSDGNWFFRHSSNGYSEITSIQWGLPGDIPLVGDYDGDSISDLAVYRPLFGTFYVLLSSGGFDRNGALSGSGHATLASWLGGPDFDPIVGDFTGDGKADFTTVWRQIRFWTVKDDLGNFAYSLPWGYPGDSPLSCRLSGKATSDRVVVRLETDFTLRWFAVTAENTAIVENFGSLGDIPNCNGDYDGDGIDDLRVYRDATGEWFIKNSTDARLKQIQFGLPGDIAL